jgi:hypothetical protein
VNSCDSSRVVRQVPPAWPGKVISVKRRVRAGILSVAACLVWLFGPAVPARADNAAGGGMLAVSDGHGTIRLLWFPPVGRMPNGGWQILELGAGGLHVVAARVSLGNPAALARLSVADQQSIRDFFPSQQRATRSADLANLYGVLGLKAFTNQTYAEAAGLTLMTTDRSGGERRYRAVGLNSAGSPAGPVIDGPPVNPLVPTPLPPAVSGLHGASTMRGVVLFWNPPQLNRTTPVIAYAIERDGGGQRGVSVTQRPLVLTVRWRPDQPEFIDALAPTDTQLTYRVYALDPFGRRSQAAVTSFFAVDMQAIAPVFVSATAGHEENTLHWRPREDRHTAGYVVERSTLYEGPYVPLTIKPLGPTTGTYVDRGLRGGTVYYYRVLAVSPQGDLGPPSLPVAAQPTSPGAPAAVTGLHAEVGRSRVRLTWQPARSAIAGYFIERRTDTDPRWETLNAKVTPAPLYDDFVGLGTTGTLMYRVVAVGFDSKESSPSQTVAVTLLDTTPPGMPYVRSASGRNGIVTIGLAAAAPAGKTAHIIALRSGAEGRLGVVMGLPMPGSARVYVDRNVEPGQDYWYRFVAVDRYGNRSQPTRPVVVHVGSPPLPVPAAPGVSYRATPFAHVQVTFGKIPHGLAVVVERRPGGKGPWLVIAGPVALGTKALDVNPPRRTRVLYRIVYEAANGALGQPSAPAEVTLP